MITIRTLAALIALMSAVSTANTQNPRVFPRSFAKKHGSGIWLGLYEKTSQAQNLPTVDQVFFATGPGDGGPVGSLAFRPVPADNRLANFASPQFFVDLELFMGHSTQTVGREHYDIRKNRGNDFTNVVSRKKIRFPPLAAQRGSHVRPFHFIIPFDRKFVLKPSSVGMFELHLHSSTLSLTRNQAVTGGAILDSGGVGPSSTDPRYLIKNFGRSCPQLIDNRLLLFGPVAMGSTLLVIKLPEGVRLRNRFSVAYMGFSKSAWQNLPLPFDLTPFGAPGCQLLISMDFPLQLRWNIKLDDMTLWRVAVPVIPALTGKKIFFQAIKFRANNTLGIGVSQGIEAIIGPVFPSVMSSAHVRRQTMPYDADNASWGGPIFELR